MPPAVACTYREERLVRVDHPLDDPNDGGALLGAGGALDHELFVRALLLVKEVGSENGGQVERSHLVPWNLNMKTLLLC